MSKVFAHFFGTWKSWISCRLFLVLSCLFVASTLQAVNWLGLEDSSWDNNANWQGDVPASTAESAFIQLTANDPVISSGNQVCNDILLPAGWQGEGAASLTITGGSLNARNIFCGSTSPVAHTGVLVVTGGSVNLTRELFVGHTSEGGILEVSGGDVTIASGLRIAFTDSAYGQVTLTGGSVTCSILTIGANGLLDIAGGQLTITNLSARMAVRLLVDQGKITAYGGQGRLVFGSSGTDLVLTAYRMDELAHAPSPADLATQIASGFSAQLSWTPSGSALSHDIYFSAVADEVIEGDQNSPAFQGNQQETTFDTPVLEPNTVYYWRVDEVTASNTNPGEVWSFRTDNPGIIRPTIGVIRWDMYSGMAATQQQELGYLPGGQGFLAPEKWNWRAPFFCRYVEDVPEIDHVANGATGPLWFNSEEDFSLTREVTDQEIAFAGTAGAGLDYWIFGTAPASAGGNGWGLHWNLDALLQSERRQEINYAMMYRLDPIDDVPELEMAIAEFVWHAKQSNYQTVLNGRPIFYFLNYKDLSQTFGDPADGSSVDGLAMALQTIRDRFAAAGLPNPYLVASAVPAHARTEGNWIDGGGFDAGNDYRGAYGGTTAPGTSFDELGGNIEPFWNLNGTGLSAALVPAAPCGGNNLPRWEKGTGGDFHYQEPEPGDLTNLMNRVMNYIVENQVECEANTFTMYSWNEHSEGGFLCPLIGEPPEYIPVTWRLDEVGAAVNAYEPPSEPALVMVRADGVVFYTGTSTFEPVLALDLTSGSELVVAAAADDRYVYALLDNGDVVRANLLNGYFKNTRVLGSFSSVTTELVGLDVKNGVVTVVDVEGNVYQDFDPVPFAVLTGSSFRDFAMQSPTAFRALYASDGTRAWTRDESDTFVNFSNNSIGTAISSEAGSGYYLIRSDGLAYGPDSGSVYQGNFEGATTDLTVLDSGDIYAIGQDGLVMRPLSAGSVTPSEWFLEVDGLVVMEAEHFSSQNPGTNAASGSTWTTTTSEAGFSGDAALEVTPNAQVNVLDSDDGPRLDYAINFQTAGTYYVWIRTLGPSAQDNSLHAGLDGVIASTGGNGLVSSRRWEWVNAVKANSLTLQVDAPGVHTFNVWMREDGTLFDKAILTTDPNFTPSSQGPPESVLQDSNIGQEENAGEKATTTFGIADSGSSSFVAIDWLNVTAYDAFATRPNIIVILTDDHGYTDLGVHGIDANVDTPAMDTLINNGALMRQGYSSSPQCSPSRAGLLTGRYQNRFGLRTNNDLPLPLTETLNAERIGAAGYVTGFVGKWHVSEPETIYPRPDSAYEPSQRGFEDYWIGKRNPYTANFNLSGQSVAHQVINDSRNRVIVQGEAAEAFIERNATDPFYLHLAFFGPHVPRIDLTDPYYTNFPELDYPNYSDELDDVRRQGLAMIKAIDDAVDGIMQKLRELGIEEDTLILFASDNGGNPKFFDAIPGTETIEKWTGSENIPRRGEKGTLWEGGINVPMWAYWKGVIPAGQVINEPVITLDFATTALKLAGGVVPSSYDGVDLMPRLSGQVPSIARSEPLFWDFGNEGDGELAIRKGDWKMRRSGAGDFLFNITEDPNELTNLVHLHPEIQAELEGDLVAWQGSLPAEGRAFMGDTLGDLNYITGAPDGANVDTRYLLPSQAYPAAIASPGAPDSSDSDGDGMKDVDELASGRNPNHAGDLAFQFNQPGDFRYYSEGDFEGWKPSGVTDPAVVNGTLTGQAESDSRLIHSSLGFSADEVSYLVVRIRSPQATAFRLYWAHLGDDTFAGSRLFYTTYNSGRTETIVIPMAGHAEWDGQTITQLRINPVDVTTEFEIDYIAASDGDLDGDGWSDTEEATAGTDAGRADSVFTLVPSASESPSSAFQWQGRAGRSYIIWYSTTLSPTDWSVYETIEALANDQILELPILPSEPRAFFRVEVRYP
ncbi:MAG: sulfatase-like hydrolase/transferase [Verrucomicrobiota bacterium]